MEKIYIRFYIIFFLFTWFGYVALHILVDKLSGHVIDWKGINFVGFFSGLLTSFTFLKLFGYSFFPRSKYIESKDNAKPSFSVACSLKIDIPQGLDFNRLKSEVSKKWIITFSDDMVQVLKFRTKLGFGNLWGAAAWLKFDSDTGKILIDCFPMVYEQSKLAKKLLKNIEKELWNNS